MTVIEFLLILLSAALLLVGMIGCIIPGLPGTPLCWAALLVGFFNSKCSISIYVLVITAIVCIAVEIVNNIVPSIFTKKSGGSKAGSRGATIGVFAGVLTGQILLILAGPFIGAFIGELIHDSADKKKALKSACYSFLGFITGTGLRIITSAVFIVLFIRSFIH